MKYLTLMNTFLVMFYIAVVNCLNPSSIQSILTIFIFALGLFNQVILIGLYRPINITIKYVAIIVLRFIIFITVPLQNNIWFHILSILISGAIDLYQYQTMSVSSAITKPIAEGEKQDVKEFYMAILSSALMIASLATQSFIWVLLIAVAVRINFKDKKFIIWKLAEILLVAFCNLAKIFFSINLGNYIIFPSVILLCSAYLRYKKTTDK